MKEYFSKEANADKLTVLSLVGLNAALGRFVNSNDTSAIEELTR